ncbi:uncharacterized protein LOC134830575 [Culicoides brevitarsis]|uniref:uncharacterized protein LOC134830575 n=1 Tax=Culicoides brevitarsis TaxID=469753 RepID=UPI00307C92F5
MDAPSMVQSSLGGALIVRNLVSGDQMVIPPQSKVDNHTESIETLAMESPPNTNPRNEDQSHRNSSSHSSSFLVATNSDLVHSNESESNSATTIADDDEDRDGSTKKGESKLPQCKIKRNYSCNNCNYFTQNPRKFLMHLRDTHGEKININECKLCLYASRHYQKLVRHMRMVHGSTEGINEPTQSRRHRSSLKLMRQKRTPPIYHDDSEERPEEPNFIPKYDNTTPGIDMGPRLNKCSMCSFTALSNDSLTAHEREDHASEEFFRCTRCNYVTHKKARYSKHIKYHSMPMIKCHMCDFRTPYKWNLDRHMKNHGGQGPFKCSACTFTADIKQSLTVHETNHHIPPIGGHSIGEVAHDWPEDLSMSSSHNSQEDDDTPLDYTVMKSPESDQHSGETSSEGSYRKKARPIPSLIPINDTYNALKIPKANEVQAKAAVNYLNEIYMNTIKSITMLFGQDQPNPEAATSPIPVDEETVTKKKSASIFEKLQEKINLSQLSEDNLTCACGYQGKCLSDIFMHQNICKKSQETNQQQQPSSSDLPSPTLASLFSSTRCQYCRHRCKTTDDLLAHLKVCIEAQQADTASEAGSDVKCEKMSTNGESSGSADEAAIDNPAEAPPTGGISWIPNNANAAMQMAFMDQILSHNIEVISENNNGESIIVDHPKIAKSGMGFPKKSSFVSMKKVFKCPHCSFWASTASRFHVHIVGHLNKKPFECSLCAYRSNWRWDITKHIRLKTVRDSNHKTAKVLMNDETGRRNYTKYNKYITLMGVNDNDTNTKQSKADDSILLQHQEQQNRENGGSTPTSMDTSNPYLASALSFGKNSHNNNNDDSQLSDGESNNNNKKTHFKCKKCNFKSYDRDEVLGHVKQHYIDAGLFNSAIAPKPMIQIATPKLDYFGLMEPPSRCVSNLMQVMPELTIKTPPLLPPPNGETPQASNPSELSAILKNNNLASNSPNSATMEFGDNMHNMVTAAIQLAGDGGNLTNLAQFKIPTTPNNNNNNNTNTTKNNNNNNTSSNISTSSSSSANTSVTTGKNTNTVQGSCSSNTSTSSNNSSWRGPAPYRCGHCHQVSNWKHVIQRHCRLKHNGNISIEQLGKTNNNSGRMREDARSRRIRFQSPNSNNNSSVVTSSSSSNNAIFGNFSSQLKAAGGVNMLEDLLKRNSDAKSVSNEISIEKKYKCFDPLCPYQSNCKSQFENHSSCHKVQPPGEDSEVFRCNICTYNVSHRHLLLQHLKIHANDAQGNEDSVDLTDETPLTMAEQSGFKGQTQRFLYFCRHCPARYLSKPEIDQHLSMHDAGFPHKCRLCSYTEQSEASIQHHLTAHTTYYQEKTKEFQRKYQTDPDHPMPRIEPEVQPSTSNQTNREQSWIVIAPPPLPANLLKSLYDQKMFGLLSLLTTCKYCPFNAETPDALQLHLVHHKRFSGKEFPCKCEHCDYSAGTFTQLTEHLKLHFSFIQNSRAENDQKNVAFYTNYDQLELKCVDLSKVKPENDTDEEPDFVFSENTDKALKQKRLEMIGNVATKDKIIVRLD